MYLIHICLLTAYFGAQVTSGSETFEKINKIDLRRELDKMTQDLLTNKDPFFHSYVFNSGVGNREKLSVDWMRREPWFSAGEAVVGWQAVQNMGEIHLLGRRQSSVTIITSAAQLSSDRSAQFHQHSISFETNVTSTSLFTRWNSTTLKPEVVVVAAVDSSTADILFYRVVEGKLEPITQWSRYKKVSYVTAVNVNNKNQLIVVDKGSPASVDIVDVQFVPDSVKLDFRVVQSFTVSGDCKLATVCRVGRQHYLVLPLTEHLLVYHLVSGHYQKHTELSISQVSQVVCFNMALQTYLAVNGEFANVLRLTEAGEFVSELMPGRVSEWLVLPVLSYRSDVLLLTRTASQIRAYTWAGDNRGFTSVETPQCDSCLEGDWSGAVHIPFKHHNCLLIPKVPHSSSLVVVGTSLKNFNPVVDKLKATLENMKVYQDDWNEIKLRISELEKMLRYRLKKDGHNEITGRWTVERVESPSLRLSSMVQPQTETDKTAVGAAAGVAETAVVVETAGATEKQWQLEAVVGAVADVMDKGNKLIQAVEEREKKAWGLDGFQGKVTFKGKLIVDNLTVSHLNNEDMDQLLHNTFRKDKPEQIQRSVTVESLVVEDLVVDRINNMMRDDLKFSDGPVEVRGDVTFDGPLTVRGEVRLDEGRVNGVNLAEELCEGAEQCSVFPMVNLNEEDVRNGDSNNNINKNPNTSPSSGVWSQTIAGRNLTVLKINGVDWNTLAENVVYTDRYQNISETIQVIGKVTSESAIWADSYQYLPTSSQLRKPGSGHGPDILRDADDLMSASMLIVSELEVTGTVSCNESEWGAEAADVVLRDANPIVIDGTKTFVGAVNVTNNAEVGGTVGGVAVADLFTSDTDQVFYGPSTLHGNITVENLTLTGVFNVKNMSGREITADSIKVLDTLNGIPVSDLIFTGDDGVTNVKNVDVDEIYVTRDIVVDGEVCGYNLYDFNERRLSLQKEQNISGKAFIKNAKVTSLEVKKLNDVDISIYIGNFDESEIEQTLYLSELHVDGDVVTSEGVNGFNVTEVTENAVWLEESNDIEGPLVFKDEAEFSLLEGQGFCNDDNVCEQWLDEGLNDVVLKNSKSVTFTGKKRFVNILNISEDLTVQEINGHKVEDILTKTTEQEITGDVIVNSDVEVLEELTVLGMLNQYNITKLGHRCSLSGNSISCEGNAVFKESVATEHFITTGKMNRVKFDTFLKSIVRTDNPQPIKGLKTFTGKTTVESVSDVETVNGVCWNRFLVDSLKVDLHEQVDCPVVFTEPLAAGRISVDYGMQADTINSVNVSKWKTDAVYITGSHPIAREIRLRSASSRGNLSVFNYGGVVLDYDVVKLHSPSRIPYLRAESVTVVGDFEALGRVNGNNLAVMEQNSLKNSGDQTVRSDLILGDLLVEGNMDTGALVNECDLKEAVTLASDQLLQGKYEFDCVEAQGNISLSEMISGINLTSWQETTVVKNGREQVISGAWRVRGSLQLKGPVRGKGRLGGVELQQLTDNITRDILDVHEQMKSNLTEACDEANSQLASARAEHCKLQYLDVTQTLTVPSGPSLATHFKSGDEDFLAVSENSCTTNIYKWNKNTGTFGSVHRETFGFALKTFIILNHGQLTYVLTESSDEPSECEYSGKHLWIFMKDHFKHVSSVSFFDGDLIQGEGNALYLVNSSGMFKFVLHFSSSEGRAFFESAQHHWNITADTPRQWSAVAQYERLATVQSASNCSGQVVSVAVEPAVRFVAVATTEMAEVPRRADYIKVYRPDGRLFDKLPAEAVDQLQWLSVPGQTWLVALQNHSALNLYQLQGPLLGFQLHMSATVDAINAATVVLPLASKVNMQPFVILRSTSAVKIVRAFVQGDPYLGQDLPCFFDNVLKRVPRK